MSQSDGLPNACFCHLLYQKRILYFSVSAEGASEENLSSFRNILLQNAMKRCSRENGFVLTLNIAGSESLPKARSNVKKCRGASIHEVIVCFFASAAGASEENLSDFFTILENAMKSATKEMFSAFLLKQSMVGNGAFRKKSS